MRRDVAPPPLWRLILYAIIAMGIPFYFFYPRISELGQFKFVFWVLLICTGLLIVFLAYLPGMIRRGEQSMTGKKYISALRLVVIILIIIVSVLKLLTVFHH